MLAAQASPPVSDFESALRPKELAPIADGFRFVI